MGRKVETSLNVKIKVEVSDGEPIESALRRFKREVNKSGRKYGTSNPEDSIYRFYEVFDL